MKNMLYRGENITKSNTEILQERSVYEIYEEISDFKPELSLLISKIRKVAGIDYKASISLKKQLPFFAISSFGGQTRKTENFEYASYFIIDIDNCYANRDDYECLRNRLIKDQRVNLMFASPGGAGIKILYPLAEVCNSTKYFSDAYRSFASQLAKEYGLEGKVDLTTSDVTRVCFISCDKSAYFNAEPEKVNWKAYLPFYDDLFDEETAEDKEPGCSSAIVDKESSNSSNNIDPDIYNEILKKLNPDRKPKITREYFVPEIIKGLEEPIRKEVIKHNILLNEIRDIHYGRKFCFTHGLNKAELNIYYGKKGFSIVITPGNGTHPILNKAVHALVSDLIHSPGIGANLRVQH